MSNSPGNNSFYDSIWTNLYPNTNFTEVNKLYCKDGHYVFKRKKHNTNQFYSFQTANKQSASETSITRPAFPKYLLPPTDILESLSKSPKLIQDQCSGFRFDNWHGVIGEYVCRIEDLNIVSKKNKTPNYVGIFEKYLNDNFKNTDDEYIYSIYQIIISNERFKCYHLTDITQKMSSGFSKKSDKYISSVDNYYVDIKDNKISSDYLKNLSVYDIFLGNK